MEALVLWEISRKQDYIFRSNKLKENKGASIIIEEITENLPESINVNYKKSCIYNGGGSSLYKFKSIDEAKDFTKQISETILREFPGVEVFMVTEEYDCHQHKITEKIESVYRKLAKKKNQRKHSCMQVAFGIERRCESTGFPAVDYETEDNIKKYISSEIKTKLHYSNKSSKKFSKLLPGNMSIKEFADLTKGNKNYMAVVHIDGNKMGSKFNKLKENFVYHDKDFESINDEYLNALRNFSEAIKKCYEDAFKYMCQVIKANEDILKDSTYISEGKFPVIPIILAGDDITYVTNGKIGIESARIFIECLNNLEVTIYKEKKVKLNACAGVALVKANYPFVKAYELAEDLCKNAKIKILEDYSDINKDYSLIDWHLEQGDLLGSIKEIREEYYKAKDGKELAMRPLYINNKDKWYRYDNFKNAYKNITERKIDKKVIPRSKLKTLREILKLGEKETKIYLKSNKISEYFSRFEDTIGEYCFNNNKCIYFDAIEIMDLFIELKERKVK